MRQERPENALGGRLEQEFGGAFEQLFFHGMAMHPGRDAGQAANGQQGKNVRALVQRGNEISKENVNMPDLAFKEQFASKLRNGACFAEEGGVFVSKLSHQLPFGAGDE